MKIFKLRNIIVLTVVVCFISGCSSEYNNDKTEPNRITVESQVTEKEQSVKKEEPKPIEKKKEPTVGMSESEIENTKLGKATSIEECRDFSLLDNTHKWKKYTWDFGGGKSMVATIYYDDGYGKVHDIEKYPKDPYGNTISSYWD